MNWWNSSKMVQNSSNLSFFIRNSRTFLFKTQEIMENSTFRKNKFPDLPEKVRNDKPGLRRLFLANFQQPPPTQSCQITEFWAKFLEFFVQILEFFDKNPWVFFSNILHFFVTSLRTPWYSLRVALVFHKSTSKRKS